MNIALSWLERARVWFVAQYQRLVDLAVRWPKVAAGALCVLVFLLFSTCAFGAVSVAWDHPTTRTDGTPLALSEITHTRLEHGTCAAGGAFGTAAGNVIVPAPATNGTLDLPVGTHCIRAYTRAGDLESAPTNAISTVVTLAPPGQPTGLRTVDQTAFNVIKQVDRFVLLPVGTVPTGIDCDTSQSVNGHYVVPRSAVTWFGSVRPDVVVAQCG